MLLTDGELRHELSAEEAERRVEALRWLRQGDGPRAALAPHVLRCAGDPHPMVRLVAVEVLRDWRVKEAIPALAALLEDPSRHVQDAASEALWILSGLDRTIAEGVRELLGRDPAPGADRR